MPEQSTPKDVGEVLVDPRATACARRALPLWGLAGASLSFISARENIVFRVDVREQNSFALRIHRPSYHSLAELESENEWTHALGDFGIETPRPVATLQGTAYAHVPYGSAGLGGASSSRNDILSGDDSCSGDGGSRVVGLIEWVDGEPMWDVLRRGDTDISALMTDVGKLIGRMHNQATRWAPSARFTRPILDADALIGEYPWWGTFWDLPELSSEQSQMILAARERLHESLLAYERRADNFSMIHSDILPQNMLLCDSRPFVFDFDDSGFGWHVYDLAVALVAFIDEPSLGARARAMIAGYRSTRSLAEADFAMLPQLMLARLMVQLGWMNHRVPVALQASPTQAIPRAELLAPRIARLLAGCQKVMDSAEPIVLL